MITNNSLILYGILAIVFHYIGQPFGFWEHFIEFGFLMIMFGILNHLKDLITQPIKKKLEGK